MNSLDSLIRSPTPSADTSPVVQPKTYKRSKSASFIQSRSGKLSFDPSHLRISRSASTQNSNVKLSSITDLKETYSYADSKMSKSSMQNQFLVEEFEPDVFGALLDFVHSSHCEVTAEILPCLLCAAEYYDLPDLGHYCWNALHKHDKPNEICTMLNSLQGYMEYSSAIDLQDKLLVSVEENPEDILNTSEVTELPYKTFQLVLERCKKARDMTRFLAIERWVETKSKNSFDNADYDELTKTLIASHVDVQNLSPEELQEVYPTGLADDKTLPRRDFPETSKDLESMTALMSATNLLE